MQICPLPIGAQPHSLFMYGLWMFPHTIGAEVSSCHLVGKFRIFIIWLCIENFVDLFSKRTKFIFFFN